MTVTGKIRKVEMREAAVQILQGGAGSGRAGRGGGCGPEPRPAAAAGPWLSTVSTPIAPTGEQWTIRSGDLEVVVVEVGGGLRSFTSAGRDVLWGFGQDAGVPRRPRPAADAVAEPDHRRPVRARRPEPAAGADRAGAAQRHPRPGALGLWTLRRAGRGPPDRRLPPAPSAGLGWTLELTVTYELDEQRPHRPAARAQHRRPRAPFGFGVHPYLTAGEQRVDELEIAATGSVRLKVDPRAAAAARACRRSTGARTTARGRPDRRPPARHRLHRPGRRTRDGRWRVRLHHPGSGRDHHLWADAAAYPWLQVFTGDALPEPLRRTSGVAVEPMTCPPDAFRSGQDLIVLAPGQEFEGLWGISAS